MLNADRILSWECVVSFNDRQNLCFAFLFGLHESDTHMEKSIYKNYQDGFEKGRQLTNQIFTHTLVPPNQSLSPWQGQAHQRR
jgi:hypothetical protein